MAKTKDERNMKIVQMRDDQVNRYSFRSIARQFDLAEPTVREIYISTKKRMEKKGK